MALSISVDPKYRTARLLSFRDTQAENLCLTMESAALMAGDLARAAEAAIADAEPGSALEALLRTQSAGMRGVAAHFRKTIEQSRRDWALEQTKERGNG